jgi:hypothetical protein
MTWLGELKYREVIECLKIVSSQKVGGSETSEAWRANKIFNIIPFAAILTMKFVLGQTDEQKRRFQLAFGGKAGLECCPKSGNAVDWNRKQRQYDFPLVVAVSACRNVGRISWYRVPVPDT